MLAEGQHLGFFGPGDMERHVEHAERFLLADLPTRGFALDLGSGGGVPGLVLALATPGVKWVLLESALRRTAFLERAVTLLDLDGRVTVVRGRAEEFGRLEERRTLFSLVTARSFGPPPVVAECAAPLLAEDGLLVVSEPPDADPERRWPAEGLALLGLERGRLLGDERGHVRELWRRGPLDDRWPRAVGVPAKRPLW